ncbi:MAG TPA: hypothetical protein VN736_17865 [Candidatus Limnocylindrales bacterium]|nr:hypothetical protein [Candidatus Limnocylindrales bacterium]
MRLNAEKKQFDIFGRGFTREQFGQYARRVAGTLQGVIENRPGKLELAGQHPVLVRRVTGQEGGKECDT